MAVKTRWYVGAELIALAGIIVTSMLCDAGIMTLGELVWAYVFLIGMGFAAAGLIALEYNRAISREKYRRNIIRTDEYVRRVYEKYAEMDA